MSNLSSRLKSRIGIYKKEHVNGKLGKTYEDILVKKVWAEIKFQSGNIVNGEGETEANNTRFKIRIRKTQIKSDYHIVYKGLVYEIEYIYPDFKKNSFMDIMAKLRME